MRLLVPKHKVINIKIILCAIAFFFLYAMAVNKDTVPLVNDYPVNGGSSSLLKQKTQLLYQLRVENEAKEKTLVNSIHESTKSN